MDGLKILIADGSSVYRSMFSGAISQVSEDAQVICVDNGREASDLIKHNDFDIIIVDSEIQNPDLYGFLKLLLREIPKAFVLVIARPSSTSTKIFLEALANGASESMTKPIYDGYSENFEIIKNKMADIVKMLHTEESKEEAKYQILVAKSKKALPSKGFRPQLILIAVSTGGPRALESIIPELSGDIPVPILVVQHMPSHFLGSLAQRLDSKSKLTVKVAEDGETITGRTVYFAPGGVHMRINSDDEIYMDDSPPINGVKPAADALFESVANEFSGTRILAVILTGMGQDSKSGLAKLKGKKRCFCIAQSEKTCVVYGMPRAVVEEDLADKVLDLEKIAPEIESFSY